jgi:hypothetical protein
MGMSTHVVGFRPPDETWKRQKAVWDACAAADVTLPKETEEFFDGERPDESGVELRLDIHYKDCCRPWRSDGGDGFEVELAKLPPDFAVIRFYNSY